MASVCGNTAKKIPTLAPSGRSRSSGTETRPHSAPGTSSHGPRSSPGRARGDAGTPSGAAERISDASFQGRCAVTSGGRAAGCAVASTAERRKANATSGSTVQRITVLSHEGKPDATPGRHASQDATSTSSAAHPLRAAAASPSARCQATRRSGDARRRKGSAARSAWRQHCPRSAALARMRACPGPRRTRSLRTTMKIKGGRRRCFGVWGDFGRWIGRGGFSEGRRAVPVRPVRPAAVVIGPIGRARGHGVVVVEVGEGR